MCFNSQLRLAKSALDDIASDLAVHLKTTAVMPKERFLSMLESFFELGDPGQCFGFESARTIQDFVHAQSPICLCFSLQSSKHQSTKVSRAPVAILKRHQAFALALLPRAVLVLASLRPDVL